MSGSSAHARVEAQPESPKRLAEAKHSRRRRLRVATVAGSLLAVALLFGLVGFQAVLVRNQSTLDRLEAEVAQATKLNQQLRLEVAELESPERIRTVALARLGMIEPETVTYLEPISTEVLEPEGQGE